MPWTSLHYELIIYIPWCFWSTDKKLRIVRVWTITSHWQRPNFMLQSKVFIIKPRRKHLPGMKTGSRSHLKKYPVTILDFTAVLHGYRHSLEADILYIIFLPLRVCHNIEFLLNSILLFYLLTLPRELLSIIFIKSVYLKYLNVIRSTPWQSLNHSR